MNFITRHLINKIGELVIKKQRSLKYNGFLFLDKTIKFNNKTINRITKDSFYIQDEIIPQSFYFLDGSKLFFIFKSLKRNNFYAFRDIKDQPCAVRLKKSE